MKPKARILVVDDEIEMGRMLADGLTRQGHDVMALTSADDAFAHVMAGDAEIVVTDLRMRGMNGAELCERIALNRPDIPVIVMTAFGTMETAVATLRAGAFDFLTKPFDDATLLLAVERASMRSQMRVEVTRLRDGQDDVESSMLGDSPAIRAVCKLVTRVAATDTSIMVTGETGTGKELVARALHAQSARRRGPFVAINCGAMPETILESELFGHARGAFTDAKTDKVGLFVEASGGTLFLDEVGEMSLSMQVKLLRALDTRMVRPVGKTGESPFDVRIVSATNRDLDRAVAERSFRADLLFRLNVIRVALPPLRARQSDVLLLAQRFVERVAVRENKPVRGLSAPVAERLLAYAWPGNVRELQNVIEHAVALAQYDEILLNDLPSSIRTYRESARPADGKTGELVSMVEMERRHALRVLEAVGGNKSMATRILGWNRKTLYRRLAQWAGDAPLPENDDDESRD